ncbi:hypothetical protein DM860_000013 [Cuscuta australis]|uniref:Uncharacterized protein n=1 Tax=Cuscuta australis TaxID=267555 RepID=A0A328CZ28_9ASTE|nr:hypothetical protein DM860_000013 [Cuscuta australis]
MASVEYDQIKVYVEATNKEEDTQKEEEAEEEHDDDNQILFHYDEAESSHTMPQGSRVYCSSRELEFQTQFCSCLTHGQSFGDIERPERTDDAYLVLDLVRLQFSLLFDGGRHEDGLVFEACIARFGVAELSFFSAILDGQLYLCEGITQWVLGWVCCVTFATVGGCTNLCEEGFLAILETSAFVLLKS